MQQMERVTDGEYQKARSSGQIVESDLMLIALKEMGVLGPKRIPELNRIMIRLRREFAATVVDDARDDREIWYSKSKFDEQLRAAVGDEYFVPWEVRHDLRIYTDGVRCIQIAEAHNKVVAEKMALEEQKAKLKEMYSNDN